MPPKHQSITNSLLYSGWPRTVWGRRGEQRGGSLPYRQALQGPRLENLLINPNHMRGAYLALYAKIIILPV